MISAGLASSTRRASKKIGCFYTQLLRQPIDHVNSRRINRPLQGADVRSIYLRTVRKLLLGKADSLALLSEVDGKHVAYVHVRDTTSL